MRPISEIIVHCSATRPEWMAGKDILQKRSEIRRWHVDGNGWSDIGYHYLIDRNGEVVDARPIERIGAHVRGRNRGTIGVCLVGGHGSSENDTFADHFTPEQDAALRALIGRLMREYGQLAVTGHNQFAAKACPGFHAPTWYNGGAAKRPKPTPPKEVVDLIEEADGDGSKSIMAKAGEAVATGGAAGLTAFAGLDPQVAFALIAGIVVLATLYIIASRKRKDAKAKAARAATEGWE